MSGDRPSRILVIEDDRDTSDLLQATLSDEGYEVAQAFDGQEGYDAVKSGHPDLLLLDIMMPQLDGLELCRRLRSERETGSLPILLLTAKDSPTEKIKGFQAGGDDYITKPFTIGELLGRVKAHLRIQRLTRELALSEERYRLLIEHSPEGILLISPIGEILFHNGRMAEIARALTSEGLGLRPLRDLARETPFFQQIQELARSARHQHRTETALAEVVSLDQRPMTLELQALPVEPPGSDTRMMQVVVRDVTRKRQVEEALLQAEKIHSLGILTAGIAHEVNNPLTAISNAIQILKKGELPGKKQAELCDLVLNHIGRIVRIVKDLNIFSRPHGMTTEPVLLQDAINETISLAKYQVRESRIRFETEFDPHPLFIFGDRNQFQQVMINLLVNAIQAISKEGVISVRLSGQDSQIRVSVEDTGCGIPTAQLARVFDPFFTTKRDWRGTGLGLAVSYRIIQLFKGTLNVESTVGKGSKFLITLPAFQKGKATP